MTTQIGTSKNDTFTFAKGDTDINGSAGSDTLVFAQTDADLTATTVESVEIFKAGLSTATTFTVDANDVGGLTQVLGSSGTDTLVYTSTDFDLRSVTLTSVEILKAGNAAATTFKLDQADLAKGGSVVGSSGSDTIVANGSTLDLSSTTLTSIEALAAGASKATTFTVNATTGLGAITGSSGVDTLVVKNAAIDLTAAAVTNVEILKTGVSLATTFTVDAADLASGGSVVGSSGIDSLVLKGTAFDLSSTVLTSIERLGAGVTNATTFTVNQADLASGGTVTGTGKDDTLAIAGSSLDLTSTTLSSVEILKAATTAATTFLVDAKDLASGGSVIGSSGTDTLTVKDSTINLTSTTLSSIEVVKAGLAAATTMTLEASDLAANGGDVKSILGSTGADTLTVIGTAFDLSATALTSIEKLVASDNGTDGTIFTLDQADLVSGGSIVGATSAKDAIEASGATLDLSSSTVSGVEFLRTGVASGTTFTVLGSQIGTGKMADVHGSTGNDTLVVKSTAIDLTSTTLTSVEVLKAGLATATTFTLDQADLAAGGSIFGSTAADTLIVAGTDFDLSSTSLSSIEILKAQTTNATTFTLDQNDIAAKGSIVGSTGASDTIVATGGTLDLSSTTLTSIENLKAGVSTGTTFVLTAAQLAALNFAGHTSGADTLQVAGSAFNLTSTTLNSIENLKAGLAGTTFTVDQADLVALGTSGAVIGASGAETLIVVGTNFDLTSTSVTSVEKLSADTAATAGTLFSVDQADLASGGSVIGGKFTDTLEIAGTQLDLSSTTLTSVEILGAGSTDATTFIVDQADLAAGGSILGVTGKNDTVVAAGTSLNLTSTTLSDIEILKSGNAAGTLFTVNAAQLAGLTTITGSTGTADTLVVNATSIDLHGKTITQIETLKSGASDATQFTVDDASGIASIVGTAKNDTLVAGTGALDLRSTTLSSVEILKAGLATGTTFTVDQADLAAGGSVQGHTSGTDTLTAAGTAFDLTSTNLTSIELLTTGNAGGTAFKLDSADLAGLTGITGGAGTDSLTVTQTGVDLTGIALTSVEVLKAASSLATTFTVDQADLATGGSVIGSSGTDTLITNGTALNLASTSLTSVEVLKAGNAAATTFTVDQADLVAGGSVIGSSGTDTLAAAGAALNLSSTSLTSVEILKAGNAAATTFTVDQADLTAGGSVVGSSGNDTLTINGTSLDLTSTSLTSVEILKAGSSVATTFTVDAADLAAGGSIIGSSGLDSLVIAGTAVDLANTSLTSVEILKTVSSLATTFTVSQAALSAGGSVIGSSGTDTLLSAGTALNLGSTALTSIEILKAGNAAATTFTVDQADLVAGGSVIGSSGNDTLAATGTALDLTSTSLTSVEIVKAANSLATTFTLDQADLASGGSVIGSSGNDTLVVAGTAADLSSTALSSIEILKAGSSLASTFTLNQADLVAGGSVVGSSGSDTIVAAGTLLDLSSTALSSIEILKADNAADTTFIVDQADLASGGSVIGSSGNDTLAGAGTSLDLSSTALSTVEIIKAGNAGATTITVDATDLVAGGSVIGSSGNDTLAVNGTAFDLTSTSLTSIEALKAASSLATTFTLDQADLVSGGSVIGSSGSDTLIAAGTALDLSSTSLVSVESLKAGKAADTTFTVDQADLASGGSVIGSSGTDTLAAAGTALNLASTTLTGVEILKAGNAAATTFTVDQADLSAGGSVLGNSGTDTLIINGTSLDLSSTSLTSVEILQAGTSQATTFTVDQADLVAGGSVIGSSGTDTLLIASTAVDLANTSLTSVEILKAVSSLATTFTVSQAALSAGGSVIGSSGNDTLLSAGTALDLTSTAITSIEILKAGNAAATTFTVDQADLIAGGSVVGSSGNDTLVVAGTALDLSSTALTSVEILKAGNTAATTFTVDQADLAAGGTVAGSSGNDTLAANGTALDLTSTTLTSVEILKAGNAAATTFTVDQADLAAGGSVIGSSGNDTLATNGGSLDLSSTALTSIEILKAGSAGATSFTVDQDDLAAGGSVVGNVGSDTIIAAGTALDLSSTTLTGVETIKAGLSLATTFTVDQADLASGGSVIGSSGNDTLVAAGTALNLISTTLTSLEILKAGSSLATTFTVDQADLASGGSVIGSTGNDALVINGTSLNLASTTLSSVETLQAGLAVATTFTVDQADLAAGGSVIGSSGSDILLAAGTALDLSSTTVTSVETLKAGTNSATTFTVDQTDLASGGSVVGSSANDTLAAAGTALNLASTSLSSIEILKAANSLATTFTVDQADLASGGSVIGSSGTDTLAINGTGLDLSSTSLSSVEILKAASAAATAFTVDTADLASGGSVIGSSGTDTLVINGTAFDLSSTSVSSVEVLKAATASATTFTLDQADLVSGGSVTGSTATDTLVAAGTSLDLSSTTLTSIEALKAGSVAATTFTVDQADLASGGSVIGSSGNDTLAASTAGALNLTSTTLTSVEILQAGSTNATTFTVDQADLASGGSVVGSSGSDILVINGATLDLTSTTISSVETLKAGTASATTFTVDQADLVAGGSVTGSSGSDVLVIAGTALDLSSTSLTSIETLKAGNVGATTFTVDQADLAASGSVTGSNGNDTLASAGIALNLTSTTLTSVEILRAASSLATTFTVDQADLATGGSVIGSSGNDALVINGASLNLTSTSLTSVEILQAGTSNATTFTIDQADLNAGGSVVGSSGSDILLINGTTLDLSSTGISSIENLKAGSASATTFIVDQADLVSGGSVTGSTASDTLVSAGTSLNLGSTSLTSVEILQAGSSNATTLTVDQADLASGGSVIGSSGIDTLSINGTSLDLSSTSLSSIEILKAGTGSATTFTVDLADLLSGGSVAGSTGNDTLVINGTNFDLSSTGISSVEILKAATASATTFTVDQADLVSGGSVTGSTASDTLLAAGTALDLSSTTLTSVEVLKAGTSNATTFTVDQADLAASGSVIGSSGNDTLAASLGGALNLTSTTLTSVEILQAGSINATTFTVDQADLASGGSVIGNVGTDILVINAVSLDLSSTTISSVENIKAGSASATTFTVDQADLVAGGSVTGSTASDTLAAAGSGLDLSSTTLTSVEILKAGTSNATTFVVDQADLASSGSVTGSSGTDTLTAASAGLNLTSTTLTSVEILKAGLSIATTFTVDSADLASGGSVIGSSGSDVLVANGAALDLSSTTLTSIETLKAGNAAATTFTVDQADLASGGFVIGSTASDTLAAAGTTLDLSSTSLTSVEILKAGTVNATTFTVDQTDLASSGSVTGSTGTDTLVAAGTALDLSSTTLTSLEILRAGSTSATTFTVDQTDLASSGSVVGNNGTDTLVSAGASFNLTSTTLTSVEIIQAGNAAATTFTIDQADLASGGSVIGGAASDILVISATSLDLSSTGISSIETIKAGLSTATTFTVDQADLASSGSVTGSSGTDTLAAAGTALDLSSTTLTSVEVLKASNTAATTFTVDLADLLSGGSVTGNNSNDTLIMTGAAFTLTSTTLSSIEILQAGNTAATTFTVDQADLISGGSVVGNISSDILVINATSLDLSSTGISSIETIKAGLSTATTFTVDQADLVASGSVTGSSGNDTLASAGTALDLSSTTLTSVEILKMSSAIGSSFTVDQADLASAGSVTGNSGNDSLIASAAGAALNLTSTTLTSVEILRTASTNATTFTVDQADLASGGSVIGSSGSDTLVINGASLDLSSTTLNSIEVIKTGSSLATTFTVDQADLAAGGTVTGSSGNDTISAAGTLLDLSSTTLSSVEILKAATAVATTFSVDQVDLAASGSVTGSSGNDTLLGVGTALNLSSTTLTSIEILQAGNTLATVFTVDQADLASGGSVIGNLGNDTLVINGATLDLTSTTLTSVEIIQTGSAAASTFTVDQADLISGGSVVGNLGNDTLTISATSLDLTSTTLSSVEILKAGTAIATTFKIDQADLLSGGSVTGSTGTDTLTIHGTSLDLTSTSLTSVEVLSTDSNLGTTFTLDQADLLSSGSVIGGGGSDTLLIRAASLDLTSTTLTSVEILQAGTTLATTFTIDQTDLASGGSVIGGVGSDVLVIKGNTIDLSSTTLTSVETIQTGTPGSSSTFTIGAGQGGAAVDLTVNAKADVVAFSTAYKVADISTDATIATHMLSVKNFLDGAGGDKLDVSALTNGTPTQSLDLTGYMGLVHPATLKDALNIAAAADGSSTSTVVVFQYSGDTYVLVDKSASATLTGDDAVIKLVGTHTLVDASNFTL
jgi:hypothetical protein